MASIQARKSANGEVSYRVQVRLRGYPIQTATFDRKTDARKWAAQTESAIQEGRYFKTSESKRHILGELIDRYIRSILPTKPKSQDKQETQLLWWKKEVGARALSDITPALLAECRDKLLSEITYRRRKRGAATTNRYLAALSHAFTIAVKEWGWLDSNPLSKVRKPKEPRGRVRFLSDNERERLLKAIQESRNPYLYLIVVLCLSTGARKMEILNLCWDDVDLNRSMIILQETKNNERRSLPVTHLALDLLKKHAKVRRLDTDLLFPSPQNPQKPVDIRLAWENAVKKAGIEDFRFHDLRHSAASYLAMNGASLAEIAEVLGHKTLQMVKRYAHLSEAHTAKIVGRMNKKIFTKISEKQARKMAKALGERTGIKLPHINYKIWKAKPSWDIEEASFILCGCDPNDFPNYRKNEILSNKRNKIAYLFDILMIAALRGQLYELDQNTLHKYTVIVTTFPRCYSPKSYVQYIHKQCKDVIKIPRKLMELIGIEIANTTTEQSSKQKKNMAIIKKTNIFDLPYKKHLMCQFIQKLYFEKKLAGESCNSQDIWNAIKKLEGNKAPILTITSWLAGNPKIEYKKDINDEKLFSKKSLINYINFLNSLDLNSLYILLNKHYGK